MRNANVRNDLKTNICSKVYGVTIFILVGLISLFIPMKTSRFNKLSLFQEITTEIPSQHDKFEEKLKSCTETDNTAEQVDTTTYQGMH